MISLKEISEKAISRVERVDTYKFADQTPEMIYGQLFQDRIKCKQFHGYMQVVTEKKCYFPGETVHGAVYIQLNQDIPPSFVNLIV